MGRRIWTLAFVLACISGLDATAQTHVPQGPMEVRTLVVKYFPVKGDRIDQSVTGDWGATLAETRRKTESQTKEVIAALQEGSRYHGYNDQDAKPSLLYKVVGTLEFMEPLPTVARTGDRVPMTDYNKIMERIGIREWVEKQGVKEVWLWDYDWANQRYVETDIEDWKPDGSGQKQRLNCDRWGGDSLKWFVYWLQSIPGANNDLAYQDRRLSNWWIFIGDFDHAMRQRLGLTEAASRHGQLP